MNRTACAESCVSVPAVSAPEARFWRVGLRTARKLPLHLLDLLLTWQERASQRHKLGQLDDRMLHDIGLSRAEAVEEAAKPFWKV